jgi:hypothetical protein
MELLSASSFLLLTHFGMANLLASGFHPCHPTFNRIFATIFHFYLRLASEAKFTRPSVKIIPTFIISFKVVTPMDISSFMTSHYMLDTTHSFGIMVLLLPNHVNPLTSHFLPTSLHGYAMLNTNFSTVLFIRIASFTNSFCITFILPYALGLDRTSIRLFCPFH